MSARLAAQVNGTDNLTAPHTTDGIIVHVRRNGPKILEPPVDCYQNTYPRRLGLVVGPLARSNTLRSVRSDHARPRALPGVPDGLW